MTSIRVLALSAILLVPTALGQWNESGDAGELPASAQSCVGNGSLTSINGVHDPNDADMYEIEINNPGAFSATVAAGANLDSQLFLFDAQGFGVAHHDDVSSQNRRSRLTNRFVTESGRYFLAISGWNRDPVDEFTLRIWNDTPTTIERAPDGPAADERIAGWLDPSGTPSAGPYTILITGARLIDDEPPACPGDVDGDQDVDLVDLATLLSNFGLPSGATLSQGDLDGDGDVDLVDLATLLTNFGLSC